MPVILKKDKKPAPVGSREAPLKVIIAAGLFLVLLIAFLYHIFVNPIVNTRGEPKVTFVKPLPGFPDTPPYNTKEWQEAFKQGRASLISGVPPPRPSSERTPSKQTP